MALAITPAVEGWIKQPDAFNIIFKAYDDNGNKCKGNQISIQYAITYDGSMPDLTQMTRVYGDASGIIALTISKPCVISLYGIYLHNVNDIQKGEVTQEIAINYEITFKPIILSLKAIYNGPDIPITNDFNGYDIKVIASMSDGTDISIPITECIVSRYDIDKVGDNIRTLTYHDPLLGTLWEIEFIVPGVPKLLSLEAFYTGQRRVLGDRIFEYQVVVYGSFLIEIGKEEQIELTEDEWFFIDIPIITEANNGRFTIGYKTYTAQFEVPYDVTTSLRLNVWYEGDKIEVGNSYDPNNLAIYLVYPGDRDKIRITYKDCTISSYHITKEGWNWFTATYIYEFRKVTQWFPVPGVIYKHYVDLDFKVLYINSSTKEETNLTDDFLAAMTFQGVFLISWTTFLAKVVELNRYGLYLMTAPKLNGLSNQYDMDWEVLCINKTTLKASIKHIYKEEDDNGKTKE